MRNVLTDLTKKLVPLTFFRRNAGEVLEKLSEEGTLILTKDGKPIAKIISLDTEKSEPDWENIAKKYFGAIPDITSPKRFFRKRNLSL